MFRTVQCSLELNCLQAHGANELRVEIFDYDVGQGHSLLGSLSLACHGVGRLPTSTKVWDR